MGTSDLQVMLACECGKAIVARARDAGASLRCTCGSYIAVPKLSELRQLVGADPFVTNPAEAIRKLQRLGINPAGNACLYCGSHSVMHYECQAICESSQRKQSDDGSSEIAGLLSHVMLPWGFLLSLAARNRPEVPDRQGHDIAVDFTLPVCDPCASMHGSAVRPRIAKSLMQKVPPFKDLLAYYPNLKLYVTRPPSERGQ